MLTGLLQLAADWDQWRSAAVTAVSPQSRMLSLVLLPTLGDVNTSHQYCTGCLSTSTSATSWLLHRALSGQAADYLIDDCQLVADSRRPSLRSFGCFLCTVPHCNSTFGKRWFSDTFGKRLKTQLFSAWWGCCTFVTVLYLCAIYKCSYLLIYLLTSLAE